MWQREGYFAWKILVQIVYAEHFYSLDILHFSKKHLQSACSFSLAAAISWFANSFMTIANNEAGPEKLVQLEFAAAVHTSTLSSICRLYGRS